MEKYISMEQALQRIKELETENELLLKKLEQYENRDWGGRRKHDDKWQASYDLFVQMYEQGLSIVEIVEKCDFSQRTCYRYKAYYDEVKKARGSLNEKKC